MTRSSRCIRCGISSELGGEVRALGAGDSLAKNSETLMGSPSWTKARRRLMRVVFGGGGLRVAEPCREAALVRFGFWLHKSCGTGEDGTRDALV